VGSPAVRRPATEDGRPPGRRLKMFPEADTALRPGWDGLSPGGDGPPTEHGHLEREQDTPSLIGFGCPELRVLPVRRQGLEPRTVALRGHCSAN
jgi:hypothetical protein